MTVCNGLSTDIALAFLAAGIDSRHDQNDSMEIISRIHDVLQQKSEEERIDRHCLRFDFNNISRRTSEAIMATIRRGMMDEVAKT
jgi:hypothetical protein